MSMLDRFRSADGKRLIADALNKHPLFGGDQALIQEVASIAIVAEHSINAELIQQDAADNEIFFILSGTVAIEVHRRVVNKRVAGQHVGEMALIDPTARRSATVRVTEIAVTARLSEPQFAEIANRHPVLWRRLAVELADRLRQRNQLVTERRLIPHVFIGSSSEALEIAKEIEKGLFGPGLTVQVWTDGIFTASKTTIEALETALQLSDFAVLVLAPDDVVFSRGMASDAPRDNVVFELGLFMGALSRLRTFLVSPKNKDIKLPTDLLGITRLTYAIGATAISDAVAPVCADIRKLVLNNGAK
jgi:CRP/FNR family transcriptional regulator, cyclic AMP receptor protein